MQTHASLVVCVVTAVVKISFEARPRAFDSVISSVLNGSARVRVLAGLGFRCGEALRVGLA